MRLVDADALLTSIKESVEECRKLANEINDGEMYARVSQSIATFIECALRIKNAPTVDAIPVVRCVDCKYGEPNGRHGCKCYHYKLYEAHEMSPNDFCSYAERRTDETN